MSGQDHLILGHAEPALLPVGLSFTSLAGCSRGNYILNTRNPQGLHQRIIPCVRTPRHGFTTHSPSRRPDNRRPHVRLWNSVVCSCAVSAIPSICRQLHRASTISTARTYMLTSHTDRIIQFNPYRQINMGFRRTRFQPRPMVCRGHCAKGKVFRSFWPGLWCLSRTAPRKNRGC